MCGRVVWVWDAATGQLVRTYDDRALDDPELSELLQRDRYNVPPSSTLPFILGVDGDARVEAARWGFPTPQQPNGVFNTRVESTTDSRMWRGLAGTHHCILPVKGFYEWRRDGQRRTPHFIHRADEQPMLLAGLYGRRDIDGKDVLCASILTCPSNDVVGHVHDRMPVILERDEADEWLDPRGRPTEQALELADAASDDVLAMHEVSSRVNRADNDGPDLIEPTGQQTLF